MIICGFPGIGKSCLAKKEPGVVDLESTPFKKDWEVYSNVANHMNNNGYTVLVSSHKEMRDALLQKNIPFTVIMPSYKEKPIYINRYIDRNNDPAFIEMMKANYDSFIYELTNDDRLDRRYLYGDTYLSQFYYMMTNR